MSTSQVGFKPRVDVAISSTDLPNNVVQNFLCPDDGVLSELAVVVQAAITTGGTITVQNSAGVAVGGLQVTVPNGTAAGTILKATANKGDVNRPCLRDGLAKLVPAGFATAGAVRCAVTVRTNDNPQQPF